MVQAIKRQILTIQLIPALLLTGCAALTDPEMFISDTLQTATRPLMPLTEPLGASQIYADQLNSLVSGVVGPNSVSGGLLEFQNYNRGVNSAIQNPWDTVLDYRDVWLQ